MVLLAAAGGSSSDRKRSRQFVPSRRRRMMANVRAERLLKIPAEPSPELRIPALQLKREWSPWPGIRLGSWESARAFKGIFCADISEIAVGTLITERPPHRAERAPFGHSAPTSGI